MARITLPNRDTLPDEIKGRWDTQAARGNVLNILRVFMANPGIRLDAAGVWKASGLTPRVREFVILRCAYRRQSTYEWHQHVRIAETAGLTRAEMNAVRNWQDSTAFTDDERGVLAYTDALADNPRPTDEQYAAFAAGRSDSDIVGITVLVTLYFQLAHVMAALDLETEEPFVGWDLGGA